MVPCCCASLYGNRQHGCKHTRLSADKGEAFSASFGCEWFQRWDLNTQKAIAYEKDLVVVYKAGHVNDKQNGLGNVQKVEVNHLDELGVKYIGIDVNELLRFL